jgi:RNA polymerase sigma-70 factor (ECF subfamily)
MEDNRILEYFFERNEAALSETKTKYGARLFKIAFNIMKNKEDAEECVSDTLFKAWEAIPPTYPGMLGAYLAKIVRNVSLHKWEAERAAKRGGGETNLLLGELETELGDCVPTAASQPEKTLEAKQIQLAINSWLSKVDKTTKTVFVLRYFHGESIREVAERFKISESKVKSILFRARKKLSTHMAKEGAL